ncbi:diadenylate cyclase CdaA [Clostridium sp.]|uniref:diadenylate cyclase CdaA n=1 Tax=Clostridium sp. TaxID=1506 RepID=UPI00261587F9|nr:diadenylate cyclase CdaA [Clostridium sp.]
MKDISLFITNTIKNISIFSVLDIIVVAYIFYKGYMIIKETRAGQLLKGIMLMVALIPISYLLNLEVLNFILNKTLTIGLLSIVIIFQPEIRKLLEHIGRTAFEEINNIENEEDRNIIVNEIVNAVETLAETKTGALLVIEQATRLGEVLSSGTILDAKITSNLLENIFVVNTPLHDGATIIRKDRILASGCVLPLTNNNNINKKLGTRHRAALGLSELSDAIIIAVSEETGTISLAINGKLTRNYDKNKLRIILVNILKKKEKKNVKTAGEKVKSWIKVKKTKL